MGKEIKALFTLYVAFALRAVMDMMETVMHSRKRLNCFVELVTVYCDVIRVAWEAEKYWPPKTGINYLSPIFCSHNWYNLSKLCNRQYSNATKWKCRSQNILQGAIYCLRIVAMGGENFISYYKFALLYYSTSWEFALILEVLSDCKKLEISKQNKLLGLRRVVELQL